MKLFHSLITIMIKYALNSRQLFNFVSQKDSIICACCQDILLRISKCKSDQMIIYQTNITAKIMIRQCFSIKNSVELKWKKLHDLSDLGKWFGKIIANQHFFDGSFDRNSISSRHTRGVGLNKIDYFLMLPIGKYTISQLKLNSLHWAFSLFVPLTIQSCSLDVYTGQFV